MLRGRPSFEEAIANAAEALDEWLADPSLAEDFAEGAIVALISVSTGEARPDPRLDPELMAEVNRVAHRTGLTVASFLAAAAREKVAAGV